MRNVFSAILFAVIFIGLGALVFASAPVGNTDLAVQPDAPEAAVVAGAPQAAPAAGGKWNSFTYVLDSGFADASAIFNDINATTGVTATALAYYTAAGGLIQYNPGDFIPFDFPVTVGQALFVLAEGSLADTYTLVGNVPAQGSVTFNLDYDTGTCSWNYVSLPLDKGAIINASGLLADINTGGAVATKAGYYDATSLIQYDPGDFIPNDFEVKIGYPYFVCVTADKNPWPVYP